MPEYRVIIMNRAGHIIDVHVIDANDDDTATERAKQFFDEHDVDVWKFERKIDT